MLWKIILRSRRDEVTDMRIIKKHPVAFTFLIAWELFAASMLLAVKEDADDVIFVIVGLMAVISVLIAAGGIIAWIISAIRKSKNRKKQDYAKQHADRLARVYMMSAGIKSVAWIFAMMFLPIIPVLFVHQLGYYMAGFFFMALGIMIWVTRFSIEYIVDKFYRIRNTEEYFDIKSGDSDELLDSLYGDCVHVYSEENWSGSKTDFIANLLHWEGSLGKTIKCYRVSNAFLRKKYGYDYNENFDRLILVPFSQFDFTAKSGQQLLTRFNTFSMMDFTALVNLKYQEKNSLDVSDYAFTDESLSLYPIGGKVLNISEDGDELRMAISSAGGTEKPWMRYFCCLMVLKNAQIISGEPISGESYIESFRFSDENEVEITMTTIPTEDLSEYSDEEFFDGITTVTSYSYDSIQWYWDGVCNAEKAAKIQEKIYGEQ